VRHHGQSNGQTGFQQTLESAPDAWQCQSAVMAARGEVGCRLAKGFSVSSSSSKRVAVPRARSNARNPYSKKQSAMVVPRGWTTPIRGRRRHGAALLSGHAVLREGGADQAGARCVARGLLPDPRSRTARGNLGAKACGTIDTRAASSTGHSNGLRAGFHRGRRAVHTVRGATRARLHRAATFFPSVPNSRSSRVACPRCASNWCAGRISACPGCGGVCCETGGPRGAPRVPREPDPGARWGPATSLPMHSRVSPCWRSPNSSLSASPRRGRRHAWHHRASADARRTAPTRPGACRRTG
jgi:hypothetical protein